AAHTPDSREREAGFSDEAQEQARAGGDTIKGSGKSVTREIKLADFSKVEAGAAFEVLIVKGEAFGVKITADDNLIDDVSAARDGTTLHIGLKTRSRAVHNGHWKAEITMPKLEGIKLDGASQGTFKGFEAKSFTANVAGASKLTGDLKADNVKLAATGASKLKLLGSARDGTVAAEGASALDLQDFALVHADVKLSGASKATVRVSEKLDYNVSGASSLSYRGSPTIGTKVKTGAARVKGEK